ncbi:MAG: 3-dehydroquinate synthase, partial [Alphaproteobacteria bacterium]
MTDTASLTVALNARAYDIKIGPGLLHKAGEHVLPLLHRPFTVIVTDETVAAHHLATLQAALDAESIRHESIVLPAGESTKSFAQLENLCTRLLELGVERKDSVIAFGGGVIGDLTGFAASILRRGVSFIQ